MSKHPLLNKFVRTQDKRAGKKAEMPIPMNHHLRNAARQAEGYELAIQLRRQRQQFIK